MINERIIYNEKKDILMGDIYWANLKTAYEGASIQTGKRPVVIVSNNLNNRYCSTVNVLPITSKDKKPLPVHVCIEGCGLLERSVVLAEQITTIPKSALGECIGECTLEIFDEVNKAMQKQNGHDYKAIFSKYENTSYNQKPIQRLQVVC